MYSRRVTHSHGERCRHTAQVSHGNTQSSPGTHSPLQEHTVLSRDTQSYFWDTQSRRGPSRGELLQGRAATLRSRRSCSLFMSAASFFCSLQSLFILFCIFRSSVSVVWSGWALSGLALTRSMDHICPWKRHYPQINGPHMVFYIYKQ